MSNELDKYKSFHVVIDKTLAIYVDEEFLGSLMAT